MSKALYCLLFFSLISYLTQAQEPHHIDGQTQGTTYSIQYYDTLHRDFTRSIDSILMQFSQRFSSYDSLSLVSALNKNKEVALDSEFITCFTLAQEISKQTDGAFDITVSPLVEMWGFGSKQKKSVDSRRIDSVKQFIGYTKVRIQNHQLYKDDLRVSLVFNAIAQGYSVDLLAEFLLAKHITNFFVEIGGEVRVNGCKPDNKQWVVGVEKPDDNQTNNLNDIVQLLHVTNTAISTSGNYRNYYYENGVKFAHTIDPKTGYPVQSNLLSATIITEKCARADAYATACMVMGLEKAKRFLQTHPEINALLVYSDKKGVLKTFATKGALQMFLK